MLEPSKICAEIESHPPLMQEEAQKQYVGQEVEWLLTFISGYVHAEEACLRFRSGPHFSRPFAGITGKVALSKYAWLKTLRAETPVRVKGRIREVGLMAIELDIQELSLPEPAMESQK